MCVSCDGLDVNKYSSEDHVTWLALAALARLWMLEVVVAVAGSLFTSEGLKLQGSRRSVRSLMSQKETEKQNFAAQICFGSSDIPLHPRTVI